MRYEEIDIGQIAELSHTLKESDVEKFVELTGDDNKLHVDADYASKTSFKKPVVHGMIGASFISTLIGTRLPGDGALWFSQTLDFLMPVRIGDKINVRAEVTNKHDRDNVIVLAIEILNQNRQVVTRGTSKVKIIEQEDFNQESGESQKRPSKVALVVGATGGIGQACSRQLALDGYSIILHYHSNKEKAQKLKNEIISSGGSASIVRSDIFDDADILQMMKYCIERYQAIDLLVNCAAVVIPAIRVTDLLWQDMLHQYDSNIRVNLMLLKSVLPYMTSIKSGKIVFIGTVYTDKPNPNLTHYITAKSALEGFTKSIALELSPKGINVNMVSPSLIKTNLTADVPEKVQLLTASQTPLRRLAVPEDVAGVVSFLGSEKSNYLSGENIRLNGGQVMV
jgi:3-oxoacyl-[acyl-carrier protein] reductase